MCYCFDKLLEKGYAQQAGDYHEVTKEFRKLDTFWLNLKRIKLVTNYCPICGENIHKAK
jgi:hypothetical protein